MPDQGGRVLELKIQNTELKIQTKNSNTELKIQTQNLIDLRKSRQLREAAPKARGCSKMVELGQLSSGLRKPLMNAPAQQMSGSGIAAPAVFGPF